ncbi:putative RNA-binding protein associated with RNAse of E/G family [Sporosarcina luteola]|nr:putative RNA-binding protein associated with RNAse of E/G family [Sporosarcina luteola]
MQMHEVAEPLVIVYSGTPVCIADEGYSWLQHFPLDKSYSITTVIDDSGDIVLGISIFAKSMAIARRTGRGWMICSLI